MAKSAGKDTLRSSIKKYILRNISNGTFIPGERIVETKLAKELNVSQAPVREAILELSLMGVLEERPYSGSFVHKFEAEEIEEYFNARAYIEEYGAKRAAKYRTQKELDEMLSIIEEMESCESIDDFVDLDHEFHSMIMDAAKNKALKRAWTSLSVSEWTYQSALATRKSLEELKAAHRNLYDCIASGKDHTAGAYMFLHISNFSADTISHINEEKTE